MIARLFLLPFFLIAGASALPAQSGGEKGPPKAVPVARSTGAAAGYQLRADDVVKMTVYQEDELLTQARITKSGDVSFPLIGAVVLKGLTISEAEKRIAALYDADYIIDPKVTISISDYAKEWITVLGAVNQPGSVALPAEGKLDLLSAIAGAGGVTEQAVSTRVVVKRRASGGTQTVDLKALQGGSSRTINLGPGDTVRVPQSVFVNQFVTVMGNVNSPGAIEFPVDGKLDLLTAIARAGGYNKIANSKKVTLKRGSTTQTIDAKDIARKQTALFYLKPGDTVFVHERLF